MGNGLREAVNAQDMKDDRPKRDSMSLEEATISNMWGIAALVEVLERKGSCTKHKCSWNGGGGATMRTAYIVHWGIDHRPLRHTC
jgi:hypothetical protein